LKPEGGNPKKHWRDIHTYEILDFFIYDHREEQEMIRMEEQEKFYMQLLEKEKMFS